MSEKSAASSQRKSGGDVKSTSYDRRSTFKFKEPQERGLVQELPLLKYSPKFDDQISVKYIDWKERLYEYVQNNGNYSPKVAKIFKGRSAEPDVIPEPPAERENQIPWHVREAWKDDRKRVIEKNDKLENDKRKVYALILGQCSKALKQKLANQK